MTWVIYDKLTFACYRGTSYFRKEYATEQAAKAQMTRRRLNTEKWAVISLKDYLDLEPTVTVTNLMSGKPVELKLSDVGGCCDPSTERYWTM